MEYYILITVALTLFILDLGIAIFLLQSTCKTQHIALCIIHVSLCKIVYHFYIHLCQD